MTEDRLISSKELQRLVPYSRMHIWRLEKTGAFPRRVKLGVRRVAWRMSEISTWIESRPRG